MVFALLCVFFYQSRLLILFFLLPIGIAGYLYSSMSCWLTVLFSSVFYGLGLLIFPEPDTLASISKPVLAGFFFLACAAFGWIVSAPGKSARVRTYLRLIIGSVAVFAGGVFLVRNYLQQDGAYQFVIQTIETAIAIASSLQGADVVQQSLINELFSPEVFLETMRFVALRGGGIAWAMVFLFISRQGALGISGLIRRQRFARGISAFKAPGQLIWVLSFSIFALLISFRVKLEIPEIAAWNVFIVCVMVYIAQGGGIVTYYLNRPGTPRFFRVAANICVILMIFRPGMLAFVLVPMAILGIIENWVPLRVPKTNGSSSTPGM